MKTTFRRAFPFAASVCLLGGFAIAALVHPGADVAVGADPLLDQWSDVDLGPGNDDAKEMVIATINREVAKRMRERQTPTGRNLSNRDFRNATIRFDSADLLAFNFDNSDFTGAEIEGTGFVHCSFRGALLRRLYVQGEIRKDCDLTDADISGSSIWLTPQQLQSTKNFKEKDLANTFIHGDFAGLSFAGFNLRGTRIHYASVEGCDFSDADITDAVIEHWKESIGNSSATFSKEQLASTKSYKQRNLDSVTFSGSDFRKMDFSRMDLGLFRDCDLREAVFADASFTGATTDWRLPGGRERGGAYGLCNCQITAEQFYATRTYKLKRLPKGFRFQDMNLNGWDFRGIDLHDIPFDRSTVTGAKFDDLKKKK